MQARKDSSNVPWVDHSMTRIFPLKYFSEWQLVVLKTNKHLRKEEIKTKFGE
jgi:hypothetical protein